MADSVIRSIGLCAGVGMLDLGLSAGFEYLGIGHRTIAYCEREAYAASQLLALMESECLDAAPIWPDLTTFPASEFRGVVDCVTAGFPCQPHSVAGKREGTDDARWIWPAIVGIIRDSGAWLVVLENVRGLLSSGGMAPVLADLADLGFAAEWTVLGAGEVGASHKRERVFIVGVAHGASGRFGELRQSSGRDGQPDGSDCELAHSRHPGPGRDASASGQQPSGRRAAWSESAPCDSELADPARHGGDGSHRESGSGRGVCGDGGEVADAGSAGHAQGRDGAGSAVAVLGDTENNQRRGELATGSAECGRAGLAGNGKRMADTDGASAARFGQYGRFGDAKPDQFGCGSVQVADTSGAGLQKRNGGGSDDGSLQPTSGAEFAGVHRALDGRDIFAPGPSDPRWPGIIRERPDLAPAVESSVRGLAHGMAGMVDESRRDQLRAIGNGVCPLQASAAIVALITRFEE